MSLLAARSAQGGKCFSIFFNYPKQIVVLLIKRMERVDASPATMGSAAGLFLTIPPLLPLPLHYCMSFLGLLHNK